MRDITPKQDAQEAIPLEEFGLRMQALSKVDFRIPSKVIGDQNADSPLVESESPRSTEIVSPTVCENVTPVMKRPQLKSR